MSAGLGRRGFFTTLATVGAVVCLGRALLPGGKSGAARALRARLRYPAGAAALGGVYLDHLPAEREVVLAWAKAGPGLLNRIDEVIESDLASGQIADLNGWTVSRTEARLYALLHLVP